MAETAEELGGGDDTMVDASPHMDAGVLAGTSRDVALLEELGLESLRDSLALIPVLLSSLKDDAHAVVKQSIACGTKLFRAVLEEMALQIHTSGNIESWLEEMWGWMVKFKDAMYGIVSESGSVRMKILAVKFLENYLVDFTVDTHLAELPHTENTADTGKNRKFRLSWLSKGNLIFTPAFLVSEANKTLRFLCNTLQLSGKNPGSFTITMINCLAAVARRRPPHFSYVLSALREFYLNFFIQNHCHAASIRYSLRTSILGFVKCNHPSIIESRAELLDTLRAMNPGEATGHFIHRAEKMRENVEYFSCDVQPSKDNPSSARIPPSGDTVWNLSLLQSKDSPAVADSMASSRTHFDMDVMSNSLLGMGCDFVQNDGSTIVKGSSKTSITCSPSMDVDRTRAMVAAFLQKGGSHNESLEIFISSMHPDLLADVVIENMEHLMHNPLLIPDRYGNFSMNSQNLQNSSRDGSATPTEIC